MSDIFKIVLTSALTILGGLIIFLFSQIVSKFFIDPIHEQKKIIGEIADKLIFYANVYANTTLTHPDKEKAHGEFRKLATALQSKTQVIPWYDFLAGIGMVKHKENINSATKELIRISNQIIAPSIDWPNGLLPDDTADRVADLLDLRIHI